MPHGAFAASNNLTQTLGEDNPVTFKNVVDFQLDYTRLNYLDRAARYLLAVAYSSVYRGTDTYNQAYVAARTVAVGLHDNVLYVTANDLIGLGLKPQKPTPGVRYRIAVNEIRIGARALEAEMRAEDLPQLRGITVIAQETESRTYHAEMQLVDHFSEEKMRFEGDVIGVSKPCCAQCATRLDALKIAYSYWHDQNVGRDWQPSKAAAKWW